MPSPKGYDRKVVLDRAIELFRRQGYSATSTAQLVDELQINRKSMYAEFGSKQELFEAALKRYSEVNLSRVLAPIEAPDANAGSIRAAFLGYASASETRFRGLGCLMANTAVERAALDRGSAKFVDAYLGRLSKGFRNAVENAKMEGNICDNANLDDLTAHFVNSVVGISALLRAKASPEQMYAAGRGATSMLVERNSSIGKN